MPRFALLLACLAPAFAQGNLGDQILTTPRLAPPRIYDNNFNNWFVYSGDHRVHGKWGAHIEAQWRRNEFTNPQQLLLRWAANYQLTPNVMLSQGYGYITTHRYGDFPVAAPFPEHRLYQQLIINKAVKGNTLQSRFRFEERWIGVKNQPSRYQNRLRYQLRWVRDLRDPWYVASYNEIKFNIAPVHGARIFDQNRAFIGGGIRLNRYNRLEMGYLNQALLQRNGRVFELNHILHVAIYSTLPFGD